jgi:hypothetical protein
MDKDDNCGSCRLAQCSLAAVHLISTCSSVT